MATLVRDPDRDESGRNESGRIESSQDVPVTRRRIHGYERAFRLAGDPTADTTILLLHGIGDSSESWVPLIDDLARHHRVIAPDLLGHGQSDKPRADYSAAAFANGIRDLLDVLDTYRVTIVGHSLGGGIAAQFAYQYPDRVERLVLVAAGGVGREVSPFLRLATLPLTELGVPLLHTPPGRLLTSAAMALLKLTGSSLAIDADELGRVMHSLPEDGAFDAFTRTLRSVVDWRGQVVTLKDRAYLAEHIPMAVMWGRLDAIIPVEHAEQLQRTLPRALVSIYENAGHFPHHSDQERFVGELLDFIASTEPSVFDAEDFKAKLREETRVDQPEVTAA